MASHRKPAALHGTPSELFTRSVGIVPANAPSAPAHRMPFLLLYLTALSICPSFPSRGKVDLSSLKQNRGGNKAMGGRPGGDGGGRRVIPDGRGGFTIATTPQAQDFNSNKRSRGFEGGGGGGRGAAVAAVAAAIPAVYREAGFSVSNLPSGKKLSGGKGRGAVGMKGKKVPAQQQNWRGKGATKAKGLSNGGGGGGAKEERSLEDLMFGGLAAVRR